MSVVSHSWVKGPVVICNGLRIGFRANRSDLLTRIPTVFLPGSRVCRSDGNLDFLYSLEVNDRRSEYRALIGAGEQLVAPGMDQLLDVLGQHLQQTIVERATEHVFVHAGAVAWQGRVILMPGRTHSGKSTLVREFIRAGAVYFSDEYAVLDEDGSVHPFARPVSLRSHGGRIYYSPSEHGEPVGSAPLPVGLVVLTRYAPQSQWAASPVTEGRALLAIADNTVAIRASPGRVMRILKRVVSNSRAVSSTRGEAKETVPVLLDVVEKS